MVKRKIKVRKILRIRGKICRTGILMLFITLFLGVICCFRHEYFPAFIFSVILCVLTLIPMYYVEQLDVEKEV